MFSLESDLRELKWARKIVKTKTKPEKQKIKLTITSINRLTTEVNVVTSVVSDVEHVHVIENEVLAFYSGKYTL